MLDGVFALVDDGAALRSRGELVMNASPQRLPLIMLRDDVLFPKGRVSIAGLNGLTKVEKAQAHALSGLWVVVMSIVMASPSSGQIGGRGSGRPAIATLAKLEAVESESESDCLTMVTIAGVARCELVATQRYGARATALIRPLVLPVQNAVQINNKLRLIKAVWPEALAVALPTDDWSQLGAPIDQAETICNMAQTFINGSITDKLVQLNCIDTMARLRMTYKALLQVAPESPVMSTVYRKSHMSHVRVGGATHLRLVPSTLGLG